MITQDFDYDRGVKVYNVGDIITIIGDTSKGEPHIRGIVVLSADNGSFSVVTAHGFIGLAERVRTEPTGDHFDLSPLFDRLKTEDFQEIPNTVFRIGDVVLHHEEPAVVFYIFIDGKSLATLSVTGINLCTSVREIKATGERFDLTPMFDRLKGGNPFEDHKA